MDLTQLLEALKQANARHGSGPVVVYVVYPDGSSELLTLPGPTIPQDKSPVLDGQSAPELTTREKAAINVLQKADRPLKGRTVAARAQLSFTSHFREMMANLVARELVIVAPEGGYWLKSRPLPSAGDR